MNDSIGFFIFGIMFVILQMGFVLIGDNIASFICFPFEIMSVLFSYDAQKKEKI